jgi:hypothetical protein
MKVTRTYLQKRTKNLEKRFKAWGIHPGSQYRLELDYQPEYGYCMEFTEIKTLRPARFFLSASRLSASAMEDYQQGFFDMSAAFYNHPYYVRCHDTNQLEDSPLKYAPVEVKNLPPFRGIPHA